jgi:hypothetical protein
LTQFRKIRSDLRVAPIHRRHCLFIVATAFTRGEPTKVHHLDRDPEFLIELLAAIEIHRILIDRQDLR